METVWWTTWTCLGGEMRIGWTNDVGCGAIYYLIIDWLGGLTVIDLFLDVYGEKALNYCGKIGWLVYATG